ncbi:hypothetical protein D3C71_992090 [compost metagenome]
MRQAHGRVGLVDVLAARAGCAVGVGAHIGRVDVDLDRVINLGVDEQTGKAGVAAARRVEGALAHQAVHAGFGAQQTIGVFALNFDRGALDAGHVARGFFLDRGLEALAFGVLEVLAQQHARPVAGLGAAGAGLDVHKAVERVGLVAEHAAELQLFDQRAQLGGFGLDGHEARLVAFLLAHLIQLGVVGQLARELVERDDHTGERLLFLAQLLGLLGVVPDRRVFQRCVYRAQAFKFGIEVKDTSVTLACAEPGR